MTTVSSISPPVGTSIVDDFMSHLQPSPTQDINLDSSVSKPIALVKASMDSVQQQRFAVNIVMTTVGSFNTILKQQ
jgi:hypothetical protein